MANKKTISSVGRRKEAVVRVYLKQNGNSIMVNNRDYAEYFPVLLLRREVERPLESAELLGKVGIIANATGGGIKGQAQALKLGIARALVEWNENLRATLKKEGYLTRDSRMVERKKYGRRGARRGFQFVKR